MMRSVVIVGGGSAGWLTASLLAARHGARLQITLVESSAVPPIGVGEGTWPTMRDTLRTIGVSETALFRECEASFKQGSRFDGWAHDPRPDQAVERYHHPFVLPHGHGEAPLVPAWLARHASQPFAELVSHQPHLCDAGRAPKQTATPEYAAVANYAYHFDAGRFGAFLADHATTRLGVRRLIADVAGLVTHDNGDIAALRTEQHGEVAGDLFIDCTGLPARLLAGHYGVGFVSQKHVLFCDRALALQVPHATPDAPIASQTIATAQAHGWVWDIGLPTRRGIGLVYSSAHCSDAQAADTLLSHVAGQPGLAAAGTPRQLVFEPGHRERFWHRNCVAIGLSAGFLEPLEASAIALIEYAAGLLCDQLPATRDDMEHVARRFNERCSYRWARIIDFLKLHYVLSQRTGAFWRDHRRDASVPDSLQELQALWRHHPPSRHDLPRHDEAFPSASYQYVLYGMTGGMTGGMGFRPAPAAMVQDGVLDSADACFREAAHQARRMLPALPTNRELIDHIRRHGLAPM
jgi:glycine/D-amino acid oxidase-like deaminating enzyme